MPKITVKVLQKAMRQASQKALQIDRALGLPIYEVQDGYLVRVDASGNKTRIRKAVFGLRKIDQHKIKVNNSQ